MTETSLPSADAVRVAPNCLRCGAAFTCGMQAGEPVCWCAALPPLSTVPDEGAQCYCPACLKAMLEAAGG